VGKEIEMQKINAFLWFDNQAEEAVNFYTSIFKNSKIGSIVRYGKESSGPEGAVMTVEFELEGQQFVALNGGPVFTFTPAISFYVHCETQQEVDYYWGSLSEGGEKGQCGWLEDKYGISWQVVPEILGKLMADVDPEKARRVTEAMLQMTKLDIAALQRAYEG
jgi:predicted 3-demethylubiquinone-9 3-methyltransferase (glyoxalase superfamily)